MFDKDLGWKIRMITVVKQCADTQKVACDPAS